MRCKLLLFVFLFMGLGSCKDKEILLDHPEVYNPDLALPITLSPQGGKIIRMSDFISPVSLIDSATYEGKRIAIIDGQVDVKSQPEHMLSTLTIHVGDYNYDIPIKKTDKKEVVFSYKSLPTDQNVQMKGEMNAWDPMKYPLSEKNGVYSHTYWLKPGNYQYKMVIDGKEIIDHNNDDTQDNGYGQPNNILTVSGGSSDSPTGLKVNHKDSTIEIDMSSYTSYLALWDNHKIIGDKVENKVSITIPKEADQKEISYLRIWAYNIEYISNEVLIPLRYGMPVIDAKELSRKDPHTYIMYNVFLDRFFNGNPSNDWKNPEPDVHPRANYHGGDVAGATQKINEGYFEELGVNTLWISPVVKNPRGAYGKYPKPETTFSAYHGYWPISFTLTDDRLTSEQELKDMVSTAHNHDYNVLLDFIANHVHEEHPFYKANPDIATELYLPDGTLNTEKWDEHRLTTWFDTFMPSLDLNREDVYEMLSDSAVYWIEKYDFDGFRHDATKHVPNVFWRALTTKLQSRRLENNGDRIYQIGETYGVPELISSYLGNGLLDAQFDFNVYDAMVGTILGSRDKESLETEVLNSLDYYGDHHVMGNITGNQDRARFISYASGDLTLDEDAKYEGWNRHVGIKDSIGYKKSALLHVMVASLPGVPVIFYGDEIGMSGGNDPDNRKMMRFEEWNDKETELHDLTSKMLHLRRDKMPLLYGDLRFFDHDPEVIMYERTYLDQSVTVVINISEKKKTSITLDKIYNHAIKENGIQKLDDKMIIDLEEWDFNILYN